MESYMVDKAKATSSAIYYDKDVAKNHILLRKPNEISAFSGVFYDEAKKKFTFKSLNQNIEVTYPDFSISFENGTIPRIEWQMAILHHLATADGAALSGEFVSIREYDKNVAHPTQFECIVQNSLVKKFGDAKIEDVKSVCEFFGARFTASSADVCAVFELFPKFPICLNFWLNDAEFQGSAKLLFDRRGAHYLDAMDVLTAGEMFVSFLVNQN